MYTEDEEAVAVTGYTVAFVVLSKFKFTVRVVRPAEFTPTNKLPRCGALLPSHNSEKLRGFIFEETVAVQDAFDDELNHTEAGAVIVEAEDWKDMHDPWPPMLSQRPARPE
jgi:hypothetical protein